MPFRPHLSTRPGTATAGAAATAALEARPTATHDAAAAAGEVATCALCHEDVEDEVVATSCHHSFCRYVHYTFIHTCYIMCIIHACVYTTCML